MTRRSLIFSLAVAILFLAPLSARADVPVQVLLIKGSRQGPAQVDPRLEPLKRQLSALAYVRWEQTDEKRLTLAQGKTQFVSLPAGDMAGLTLKEASGSTATLDVSLVSRNTESRLTIEKGQRIVHQVTGEKGGSAYFLTIAPWP
jgi:hypothetical protein